MALTDRFASNGSSGYRPGGGPRAFSPRRYLRYLGLMNTKRFRNKMLKAATKDIEGRQRQLELLRNVEAKIVRATSKALETPEAAAEWPIAGTVSKCGMTPLHLAASPSGRAAVLKILELIDYVLF